MNSCIFAHVKDEKPKDKEPMYTCDHGKTLSWETARRILGLRVSKEEA